ncbi:hypothetical protein PoB_006968400 [Plakobranchus ocellatus]|uniref:Uncharacterized protein n=1 Tax=Plakobranchus ocellatus TaxID=259542 RepID=A0AAV4DG96_9GAST|nr:hypothetical protein PoB_006968400 [Plakobranchus ocellatus]
MLLSSKEPIVVIVVPGFGASRPGNFSVMPSAGLNLFARASWRPKWDRTVRYHYKSTPERLSRQTDSRVRLAAVINTLESVWRKPHPRQSYFLHAKTTLLREITRT